MSTAAPHTADPSRAVPAHALVSLAGVQVAFGPTPALRGVDLVIEPGERVAIMGPSGCGKSTLLHVIAGVLAPDAGAVHVLGEEICALSDRRRSRWRLGEVGMVFQFGDLIGELTLRENIALPLDLLGAPRAESARRAAGLLERLDIAEVADRRAHEVSGGQAQRAAVARALAPSPLSSSPTSRPVLSTPRRPPG